MTQIRICDKTLCSLVRQHGTALSFKETLEAAKLIERAGVDIIELPPLSESRKDAVTVRSIASTLQRATFSIESGVEKEAVERTLAALRQAQKPRIALCVPVSAVQMEYVCHMKPDKLAAAVEQALSAISAQGVEAELVLADATRGEKAFYLALIEKAAAFGVKTVTVCDDAGILLPDEAAAFVSQICELAAAHGMSCGFAAGDQLGVASANTAFAVQAGAREVKLAFNAFGSEALSVERWAQLMRAKGDQLGFTCALNMAELQRISKRMESVVGLNRSNPSPFAHVMTPEENNDDIDGSELGSDVDLLTLRHRIESLGYDLSEAEAEKVYAEFQALAAKKKVHNKDIEALIADQARQIPPTYKLESYIVNSGSGITATAYVALSKNGERLKGVSMGDGPVDSSFLAIEQLIGRHYELEEFHIQAVTEGREAMGDAFIKLRSDGKLYAGRGLDTDIIGSCIRAYLNAVNKIIYEESNK